MLVLLHREWPPFESGDYLIKLIFGFPLLLLIAFLFFAWIGRSCFYIYKRRKWSWRILATPTVAALFMAISALSKPPGFEEVRPELEKIAQDVRTNPGSPIYGAEANGIEIQWIRVESDGNVYFTDKKRSAFSEVGWVYAPDSPPSAHPWIRLSHLDGPWYSFEYGR